MVRIERHSSQTAGACWRPGALGQPVLVVGLGETGMSCVRYLAARGASVLVADSRAAPPALDALRSDFPGVQVSLGRFDSKFFARAASLVVSPGVATSEPVIEAAITSGKPVLGDIELFAREAPSAVVAITGSNGKSTVTTLLAQMARDAGLAVRQGGNLGPCALALLDGEAPDICVLELSSFQLETTVSLNPAAAVVLNLSPDHMDRYDSFGAYVGAKRRIYRGDGVMVVNRDDPHVASLAEAGRRVIGFTSGRPDGGDFGTLMNGGVRRLCHGRVPLLAADALRIRGDHNVMNALAALSLGHAIGLDLRAMCDTLGRFEGLAHRCELVESRDGIRWVNDSKATNVGAAVAAIRGMHGSGALVLIAGGQGKSAPFDSLREAVAECVGGVVLLGQDASLLEAALRGAVPVRRVADMAQAVESARAMALPGDTVLLSPACASLDMYRSFEARGEHFKRLVQGMHR